MIEANKIALRDLTHSDIPLLLRYWYDSDPAYFDAMGVDFRWMPSREEFEQTLLEKVRLNPSPEGPRINVVMIEYNGLPIGFHVINPLVVGDHGVFHAHIIAPEFRRRGVGQHSYGLALKLFVNRFQLKKILFRTPAHNLGPNRLKEKLGIRCIGEEVFSNYGILKDGTRARIWEITREELEQL